MLIYFFFGHKRPFDLFHVNVEQRYSLDFFRDFHLFGFCLLGNIFIIFLLRSQELLHFGFCCTFGDFSYCGKGYAVKYTYSIVFGVNLDF